MLRSTFKFVHRRALSFANTTFGFCILILVIWSLSFEMVWVMRPYQVLSGSLRGASQHTKNFTDNIGHFNAENVMAYEPIDVVYTWVNGSDEQWLAKKRLLVKSRVLARANHGNESTTSGPPGAKSVGNSVNSTLPFDPMGEVNNQTISLLLGNLTHTAANASNSGNYTVASVDADANRYRDSGELRYSLRSLVKYAPWIRRIYLVTDNQIPSWLNLENDRIKVVSHGEIFPNRSHLPVFSSPAIETHLHRIPGLAKKFIYFNDDVFLGAPTSPEDFTSVVGVQKFHFSWDVPKCAPGCSDAWIGDGFCDRACNVSACDYDYPDCLNVTAGNYGYSSTSQFNQDNLHSGTFCSRGCPDTWLGDKVCDTRCNNLECAYDMGDCGIDKVLTDYQGVTLQRGAGKKNRLAVPFGTKGAFFDLSALNVSVDKIAHNTSDVIRNAFLLKRFNNLLLFTFENLPTEDDKLEDMQRNITFDLVGEDLRHANRTLNMTFTLNILPNLAEKYALLGYPNTTGKVTGFTAQCLSRKPEHAPAVMAVDLSDRPFAIRLATGEEADQGIALTVSVPSAFADNKFRTDELYLSVVVHRGAVTSERVVRLCDSIGTVAPVSEGFEFKHKYSSMSNACPAHFGGLIQDQDSTVFHRNVISHNDPDTPALPKAVDGIDVVHLTVLVPLPRSWRHDEEEWIQGRANIVYRNHSVKSWSTIRAQLETKQDSKMCLTFTAKWGGSPVGDKEMNKNATEEAALLTNSNATVSMSNDTLPINLNSTAFNVYTDSAPALDNASAELADAGAGEDGTGKDRQNDVGDEEEKDTYGKSLIHVNRLYTKKFGAVNRKVPAHMPHMIDRQAVQEMQAEWPEHWERTSSHRTRSTEDMQYAFAYYHYVMNRNKARRHDVRRFIKQEVDTNHDGFIDDNEFHTLRKIVRNDNISHLMECLFNETAKSIDKTEHHVVSETYNHDLKRGKASASFEITAYPSIDNAMRCDLVVEGIRENVDWDSRFPTHIVGAESDIAFEMIGDNYTESLHQLDSIRSRQSKFICINDNMKDPAPALVQALHDFFESYWPFPSTFELPEGSKNRYLHLDEYKAAVSREEEMTRKEKALGLLERVLREMEIRVHTLYSQCGNIILNWLLSLSTDVTSKLERLASDNTDDDGGPAVLKGDIHAFRSKVASTHSPVVTYRELASISVVCLVMALLVVWLFKARSRAGSLHSPLR